MQAVILAAGKGTRLRPLTLETPKPLLRLSRKPILEYTLGALPGKISQVILVIGYLGHKIRRHFGSRFKGREIIYIEQKEARGTFHALHQAEPVLEDSFMVLMGDDLYAKSDLEKLLEFEQSVLVRKVEGPSEKFGVCLINKDGSVKEMAEKQKGIEFTYANCGAYKLTREIFKEKIFLGSNGEEYLSSMVGSLAKRKPIYIVNAKFWSPINDLEELENAKSVISRLRGRELNPLLEIMSLPR